MWMLLDWNHQSFSQYQSNFICITLDLFSSAKKHFNVDLAHVPVWAFSYAVYAPHS